MISSTYRLRQTGAKVRRLATENLKCCSLCGALNASNSRECFVCSWTGEFDRRPAIIHFAFEQLVDRCPELAEAILELPSTRLPITQRFKNWVRDHWLRARIRRLDLRV